MGTTVHQVDQRDEPMSRSARGRRRTHRRVVASGGLAHIEVKQGTHPRYDALRAAVCRAVRELHGVHWAEVNAVVGEVVVSFDDGAVDVDDVVSVVERVEGDHDLQDERFAERVQPHPDDPEVVRRTLYGLAADAVGLPIAMTVGLAPRVSFGPHVAAVLGFVEHHPRLRHLAERSLGVAAADVGLALGGAVAQAVGQGPAGLVVDAVARGERLREQTAVRRAWRRRQHGLVGHGDVPALVIEPRPTPLSLGPVEQWGDAAGLLAIGGVAILLVLFGDLQRSAGLAVAAVPKAARLGREAFAAEVAVTLAASDVVVLDPEVLRVLDRVDMVVIDAALLVEGGPAADDLAATARRSGLALVTAGGSAKVAVRVGAVERLPVRQLTHAIQERQREGHVVAVVSERHREALRAADLGIGVHSGGSAPPWGADVVTTADLDDVRVLLDAVRAARRTSSQSAVLAAAGSVVGGVWGLAGPRAGAAARAHLATNGAAALALGLGALSGRAVRRRPRAAHPRRRTTGS